MVPASKGLPVPCNDGLRSDDDDGGANQCRRDALKNVALKLVGSVLFSGFDEQREQERDTWSGVGGRPQAPAM
jgi:hypothetical protein